MSAVAGCATQARSTVLPKECYVDLPSMDQASFEEYDAYQAWRKAKEPGSIEYNGYLNWLEYQQYLRLSR